MHYGSHSCVMTIYKDTIFIENVTGREKKILSAGDLRGKRDLPCKYAAWMCLRVLRVRENTAFYGESMRTSKGVCVSVSGSKVSSPSF